MKSSGIVLILIVAISPVFYKLINGQVNILDWILTLYLIAVVMILLLFSPRKKWFNRYSLQSFTLFSGNIIPLTWQAMLIIYSTMIFGVLIVLIQVGNKDTLIMFYKLFLLAAVDTWVFNYTKSKSDILTRKGHKFTIRIR